MSTRSTHQPGFATRAIHHGYGALAEQGALTPPLHLTSTYTFETAEMGSEMFAGARAGRSMMNRLKLVQRAVSHGISDGLIRLSVGLEDVQDILEDLEAAMSAC